VISGGTGPETPAQAQMEQDSYAAPSLDLLLLTNPIYSVCSEEMTIPEAKAMLVGEAVSRATPHRTRADLDYRIIWENTENASMGGPY